MHFTGGMAVSLYILFPLFIRQLGGTELTIGLYAGLTGAAAVAARLPVGRLLDTLGRRPVLAAAGCLHVAAWLGFLSVDALGLRSLLVVVIFGLASGSLFASFYTYANDIVPFGRRSEGIAMFAIWGMLPNGLGPFAGELVIHHTSFRIYFLIAAVFALASLFLSLQLPETASATPRGSAHRPATATPFPWRELLFLLGVTFMFGGAINSLFTFLAPFAASTGRGGVGRFFMTYASTAVAVRVLSGRLPDRVGLRRVLIPALFLYAVGILLVPHVTDPFALILVGVMCGASHGYVFPILNVLTIERVSAAQRGRAVSWFTAMFDLGNTLANPILGAVAEWAGYQMMFTVSGLGILLTAIVVWRRPLGHRASTPA